MKVTNLTDRITLLDFKTQELMGKTFVRFQEYYESPKFHGKIFTLDEFMDWYIEENGSFSYYEDWEGMNIPSYVLKPFYDGKFDPLTKEEKKLLNLFKNRKGRFYIIGVNGGNKEAIEHEFCHALFYTNKDYKREVQNALKRYKLTKLKKHLLSVGYSKKVLEDECHAYMSADFAHMNSEYGLNLPISLHERLRKIRLKYE